MSDSTDPTESNTLVATHHCETAAEFLDALDRRKFPVRARWPEMWIFRGHGSDAYELVPSVLRNESQLLRELSLNPILTAGDQCFQEFALLREFFHKADSIGLHLPEDSQALRAYFNHPSALKRKPWPPDELLSLIALAQHHGLPTRLLDWSRNPRKAALFAALGAAKSEDPTGRISVWGRSLEMLHLARIENEDSISVPFTVVTAPSATNSNLHAQEGVFTIAGRVTVDGSLVDRTPFEKLVLQWAIRHNANWRGVWFRRITLPQKEAERLCVELAHEGIAYASLYPNFSGVVDALKAEIRWYRPGGAGLESASATQGSQIMRAQF